MLREYLRNLRLFSPNARLFLAGSFIGALGLGLVWVLRNLYLRKVGFNDEEIGRVMSGNSLGTLAITIPAAVLMDRFRLKPFLVLAALLGSLGVLGQVYARSLSGVVAWSFVSGVGLSLAGIAAAPFFMRNSGPSERVYLFGVSIALATLGTAVSMVAAGLATSHWGESAQVERLLLAGGALVALLGLLPTCAIREAAPDARAAPAPAASTPPAGRTGAAAWFAGKDWRTIGKLCIPDFLIGSGAGLTIPFINLYFETRFNAPDQYISHYYALSQLLNMLGFLASPLLAGRLGLVRSVVASQLLSIPFFAVLAFTTSLPLAVGAFLLRNLLMNLVQPLSANFGMEVVGEAERAITNCLRGVAWNLSWVVTASVGGSVIHRWRDLWTRCAPAGLQPDAVGVHDGFSLVMVATIALYLVASSLFYLLFHTHPACARRGGQALDVDLAPGKVGLRGAVERHVPSEDARPKLDTP